MFPADAKNVKKNLINYFPMKNLSPKQAKIAKAAAPKNKITGADFKALKKKK